ncbi:hypothetical protein A3Q56_05297 [Intoshia linei]|uniref:Homeobox domain-containing protein n=1 Tax=Intoshia linei TaxID=1819745 RepID=A0A177AYB5_9BILA|nr:hypothetical protein A3Q56_05297 [Intoshia linei]
MSSDLSTSKIRNWFKNRRQRDKRNIPLNYQHSSFKNVRIPSIQESKMSNMYQFNYHNMNQNLKADDANYKRYLYRGPGQRSNRQHYVCDPFRMPPPGQCSHLKPHHAYIPPDMAMQNLPSLHHVYESIWTHDQHQTTSFLPGIESTPSTNLIQTGSSGKCSTNDGSRSNVDISDIQLNKSNTSNSDSENLPVTKNSVF